MLFYLSRIDCGPVSASECRADNGGCYGCGCRYVTVSKVRTLPPPSLRVETLPFLESTNRINLKEQKWLKLGKTDIATM